MFRAQHQPAQPDIGEPGLGIDDVVDRGGDIGPAVSAVLEMHGKLGDVGVGAGQHHRLTGRLGARHLENLGLVAQPPRHFRHELVRLDAERLSDPGAAAHDIADKLGLLWAGRAEQHRFRVALHHSGEAGEIDGRVAGVEFLRAKAFDETAQPEALEVHGIRPQLRTGFSHDVHRRSPFHLYIQSLDQRAPDAIFRPLNAIVRSRGYLAPFDLVFRAAYRASLAALRSVCNASSRFAVSITVRSACNAASCLASIANLSSRAFVSAFSIPRTRLPSARSAALAARAFCRSAEVGSAALARNFSRSAFFAFAAAFRRSMKLRSLNPAIHFHLLHVIFVVDRHGANRALACGRVLKHQGRYHTPQRMTRGIRRPSRSSSHARPLLLLRRPRTTLTVGAPFSRHARNFVNQI